MNQAEDQIHTLLERLDTPARRLLALAGPPGSGKSTLAARLMHEANLRRPGAAAVVALDGFHYPSAHLDRLGLRAVKGAPHTFDAHAFIALLATLRDTTRILHAPGYSRDLHEPVADAIAIPPGVKLVIVEGNYLLLDTPPWDSVRVLLDEAWYLDVPEEACMDRVRARHVRGGCTPEQAREKIECNDRLNYVTVAQTRARAHRIIHGGMPSRYT